MSRQQNGPEEQVNLQLAGRFFIRPDNTVQLESGEALHLEPRLVDLLRYLCAFPGRVVSREELEREVWTGTVVGYDALTKAVNKLRRALGDDVSSPRIIETVPKRGYRLIAPVVERTALPAEGVADADFREKTTTDRPARRHIGLVALLFLLLAAGVLAWYLTAGKRQASVDDTAPGSISGPTVVVLPFESLDASVERAALATGLTWDMTTALVRLPELAIIARDSAARFDRQRESAGDFARRLGAGHVLQGSVRSLDDGERITLNLTEVESGRLIWAENYDVPEGGVVRFHDSVVRQVATSLSIRMLPQDETRATEPTTTPAAAYESYLLGLASYQAQTASANAVAANHFRRALDLDPGYSAARNALAKVYARATVRDQSYADALGIYWLSGIQEASRLLSLDDAETGVDHHLLRSWIHLRRHQLHAAVMEAAAAQRLEPRNTEVLEALAEAQIYSGDSTAGMALAHQALQLNPVAGYRALFLIGLGEFALGNLQRSIEYLEEALRHNPTDSTAHALLASAYGLLGKTDDAGRTLAVYRQGQLNRPFGEASLLSTEFVNPRYHTWRQVDLAWTVFSFPFARADVLERFADGLVAAGLEPGAGGYLPLHEDNRMTREEMHGNFDDRILTGQDFWLSRFEWRQQQGGDGIFVHSGYPVTFSLEGNAEESAARQRSDDCADWSFRYQDQPHCAAVYRLPSGAVRARWGDYIMVNSGGPYPFNLSEAE